MKLNFSGRWYPTVGYGVDPKTERIDFDNLAALAREHKPKLILAGASAYSRKIQFDTIAAIAREVGAVFFVDMAHIAGLVAAGLIPTPCPWPTSSRRRRTRPCAARAAGSSCASRTGPRSSTRRSSPGSRGVRLMHVIAGKAVCFGEALQPEFKAYAAQVIANAKALAEEMTRAGFRLVSGGTDNHLILIDMTSKGLTGKIAEAALGRAGITVNKNLIPFDKRKPLDPERHPDGHPRPDDPGDARGRHPPGRRLDRRRPGRPRERSASPAGSAARSANSSAITRSRPTLRRSGPEAVEPGPL